MGNSMFQYLWPLFYYNSLKIGHDRYDSSQLTRTFRQPNHQLSSIMSIKGNVLYIQRSLSVKNFVKYQMFYSVSFLKAVVTFIYINLPSSLSPNSVFSTLIADI